MRFPSDPLVRFCAFILLFSLVPAARAQISGRPSPAAGAGAKTLVAYSSTHTTYSLADDLNALKIQLRRVATQVEAVPVTQADAAKIAAADYTVVFCPQPLPKLSEDFLKAVAQSSKPVLWVGYGADQLAQQPEFKGQFTVSEFASSQSAETVNYLGHEWQQPVSLWLPVQLDPTNSKATVVMTVPTTSTNNETTLHPVCWKSRQVTFYAAQPTATANCALFSDALLDFYGVTNAALPAICLRIDGYHAHQDHLEFRNLVDNLHSRGHPFILGVIPAYYDPETKKIEDLDTQPEFVAALRYAQRNGARLVLQGYADTRKLGTGQEPEFWNSATDAPFNDDSAEYVRERVQQGVRQMVSHGLFPLGWQTPYNSASRADYGQIAAHFSTAAERVQLSDATALETFAPTAIAQDDFGRSIIPENLGALTGQKGILPKIQSRVELLTQLRGTVAGCAFPAFLADDKLAILVSVLEKTKAPFLDLADGDNWVQISDVVLLTGNATRTATLKNARIHWKAFDRNGDLLAEDDSQQAVTGEHEFKRRGKGDYEVFQINEANP